MDAVSTRIAPGDPGAGSGEARSAGGPSCSARRRGSRRDSIRCGGRCRSCHHSQGRRRSCRFGNPVRMRSDPRTGLPQPASRFPLSRSSLVSRADDAGQRRQSSGRGSRGAGAGDRVPGGEELQPSIGGRFTLAKGGVGFRDSFGAKSGEGSSKRTRLSCPDARTQGRRRSGNRLRGPRARGPSRTAFGQYPR